MAKTSELLIIGGDGDLAIRKLYPALFSLEQAGELSEGFTIVGMARKPKSRDEVLKLIKGRLETSGRFYEEEWQRFANRIDLRQGDASSAESLSEYAKTIDLEKTQLTAYFAIPPSIFESVCNAMDAAGLVVPDTRVVVEKPLGTDKASFCEIHDSLAKIFAETQVYRIDHYLGKESVQNLLALRFANIFFGSLWNGSYIENVQITIAETVGVEDRHEFYEETGALRDMVQNHMMQLLCLVALEPPANKSADMIRGEKLKVLKSLKPIELADINAKTIRGQYAAGSIGDELVPGYQQEIGPEKDSNVETYVAIKAEIDNWRWANVPFYLRTGKRMSSRCAEIIIQFRNPKHNIFPSQTIGLAGNQLRIRLQPDEGIELHFLNKAPGVGETPMEEVSLSLDAPDSFAQHSFDAYARLLLEVLNGDQTLFVSADEVIASWDWIDQIRENWQTAKSKAYPYASGTMGPSQAVVMMARDSREWIDLSRQTNRPGIYGNSQST